MEMLRKTAALAALLVLLGAAGCASRVAWQRAGADADQIAFDLQGCRSEARARLGSHQYFARERAAESAAAADATGRGDGTAAITRRWAEARDRRNAGDLVADCMARKGYRPVPPPGLAA